MLTRTRLTFIPDRFNLAAPPINLTTTDIVGTRFYNAGGYIPFGLEVLLHGGETIRLRIYERAALAEALENARAGISSP